MKTAQLTSNQQFTIKEIPKPIPKNEEVLVNIKTMSICGSDLRSYIKSDKHLKTPGFPCHECTGIVIQSQTNKFKKGDHVIVVPPESNGLSEYIAVHYSKLIKLPNSMNLSTSVLCQPLATVLYAIDQIGKIEGKTIVILGQGPIGLGFTMLLALKNPKAIIVTDPKNYRLNTAKKFGATKTINPKTSDSQKIIEDITDKAMADIVIEAAGEEETFKESFDLIRQEGMIVAFGYPWNKIVPLNFQNMMTKQAKIIAVSSARAGKLNNYIKKCLKLVIEEKINPTKFITHYVKFNEINKAYKMYLNKNDKSLKIIIQF